ncbi:MULTISPECIES: hypothetical protein [unclassified Bradyrhizobium]|uniref:hypothetical protein n=1 Tax=unclassified Bradyrhizobium TaxID=2631580 RepID=UPI002916A36C|nr:MULTISPECIES: hypothetical protein [unclassified Bradyrhizobium]
MTNNGASGVSAGMADAVHEDIIRIAKALAIRHARADHLTGIKRRTNSTVGSGREPPCVRFATYCDEDTGETTPLYLHSHEEIDAAIDRRIRCFPELATRHEATRAKWHKVLNNYGR